VVSGVTYKSFGPVAAYKLGDGQTVTLTYDATGALTDIASTAFTLHVKRDVMGNIVALGSAAGVPTPTETYGYDALYRLTGVKAASGTSIEAYTYNKTGDRLTKVAPGLLTGTYTYAPDTHHLMGVGTTTRQVDARGDTTADVLASGTYGYGYNGRNRLTVVQNNGVTVGSYVLNALGQRVQKTAGSVATRFDYDEASRLLSESTGTGTRDYVWMDNLPVGIVDGTGTAAVVNFVHADGLGSPRAVTSSTGAVLWQWAYASNPFGENVPASSVGYTLNLRYPGQYFDAESGLNYNVNRDYEAATGRYAQSDPIGLAGGDSAYGYVQGNPLLLADWLGLWDPQAAAGFLNSRYPGTTSMHKCAAAIHRALNAGGVETPNNPVPAADYANYLPKLGFDAVPADGYVPQVGDIAVFPAVPGNPSGHIEMYDGSGWHSDYVQPTYPYDSGENGPGFYQSRQWTNSGHSIFRMPASGN
jgi:RHS repeat-associated protein